MLIIILFSCIKEPSNDSTTTSCLTLSEAKAFFEDQISAQRTRSASDGDNASPSLTPGDFCPEWSQAILSQDNNIASVDVPIISNNRYLAIHKSLTNGKYTSHPVQISQKLVIVKSHSDNRLDQYLLTLIPDREYYAKNKGDLSDKFIHAGNKGHYSGLAIYIASALSSV